MGSAAPAIKAAVVTLLGTLYPAPTLASYGDPGQYQPKEIVGVLGMKSTIERPTMSTARPREEITEVDVIISVWAPGNASQQQAATERAYALLAPLTDYFKTKPNETLSGACREAWVSSYNLTETISADPTSGNPTGRVSDIAVTITAKQRI